MLPACVYSGSSNFQLARRLADLLQLPLDDTDISKFPNQEIRLRLHTPSTTAIIVQSFSQPTNSHIIQTLLLMDAATRLGADKLILVIPWLAYSRQDKVFRPGEPLSSRVIARTIDSLSPHTLITLQLHHSRIAGYFHTPVTDLSALPLFVSAFKKIASPNTIVIAPDQGAVSTASSLASSLGLKLVSLHKSRCLDTGTITLKPPKAAIKHKDVIILDDILATGSTLIETCRLLKTHGAGHIYVGITHHIYIPGVTEKINASPITTLYTTDSVAPIKHPGRKTVVLSCAPLFADAITTTISKPAKLKDH